MHHADGTGWRALGGEARASQNMRERDIGREIAMHALRPRALDRLVGDDELHLCLRGIDMQRRFKIAAGNIELPGLRRARERHQRLRIPRAPI